MATYTSLLMFQNRWRMLHAPEVRGDFFATLSEAGIRFRANQRRHQRHRLGLTQGVHLCIDETHLAHRRRREVGNVYVPS